MSSRSGFAVEFCLVFLLAGAVPSALADMIIQLKDGTSIKVPVQKENFVGFAFTESADGSGLINLALSSNGGRIASGFTGWSTPASLVIDGQRGPDDPNPNSTAKDSIAAYSLGMEPFQIVFRQQAEVRRVAIMHKFGGGGGGRDIIERARLVFSDGSSQEIRFDRTYSLQTVDIAPKITSSIKVEPIGFYPGSDRRWGVIEFEAWGIIR